MADVYRAVCGAVESPFALALPLSDREPDVVLILQQPTRPTLHHADGEFDELGPGRLGGSLGGGRLSVEADMATGVVRLTPAPALAASALAHLVVDHLLPRLADGPGICLHAAAIAFDGAAVVLIGESGAGKATLAATLALNGAELVADDCALVQDGMVYATGRGCRLDTQALTRLGLTDVAVDATGKGLADDRHGLRLAAGPRPLHRILVVGERNGPFGVADSFAMLSSQRFWLRRPAKRDLLDQVAVLLAGRPQVMEIDWASSDVLKRVRALAA